MRYSRDTVSPKFASMAMLSQRQAWSLALISLLFPCVFSVNSAADGPAPTYRSVTSEVRISFFVTDENNHLVSTIQPDDFAVVDSEQVIRDFRSLNPSGETELHIFLLIDTSESVAPRLPAMMRSLTQWLSEMPANSANLSIVTFSGLKPSPLCGKDCQTPTIQQKLLQLKGEGATPLFDALAYAANLISEQHVAGSRDVLLLFSDGQDTISRRSRHEALKSVLDSGAVLYLIDLNRTSGFAAGRSAITRMADATGGRSLGEANDPAQAIGTVLSDLRSSFVVTYQLPGRSPGFHSLRILPKHNLNLRFHCREGYYYEENR